MTPVLSVKEVSKSFQPGVPVLQAVSLQADTGSTVCLLGPSGCGKTTLLRLIAGFEEPDRGEIHLIKRLVSRPGLMVPPEQRHIGMVFQDHALFPHMTIERNIKFGLFRWPAAWRRMRLVELLQLVGLAGLHSRYPHELSGGQQQRVALARALAPNPQLLLLDEPFSHLDVTMRQQLREEVQGILTEAGITTVLVTHDQEEALSLADVLAVINHGRIIQQATPDEVVRQPGSRFVAEFLALGQFLAGEIRDHYIATEIGSIPLTPASVVTTPCRQVDVLVRPEGVRLCDHQHGTAVRIMHASFRGTRRLYILRLPSGATLHGLFPYEVALHPGDQVRVALEAPAAKAPYPLVAFPHTRCSETH